MGICILRGHYSMVGEGGLDMRLQVDRCYDLPGFNGSAEWLVQRGRVGRGSVFGEEGVKGSLGWLERLGFQEWLRVGDEWWIIPEVKALSQLKACTCWPCPSLEAFLSYATVIWGLIPFTAAVRLSNGLAHCGKACFPHLLQTYGQGASLSNSLVWSSDHHPPSILPQAF